MLTTASAWLRQLGLDDKMLTEASAAVPQSAQAGDSEDYMSLASEAAQLGDIRLALRNATLQQEQREIADDLQFLGHTQDLLDLHSQIATSSSLLDSLKAFLATFQTELAAVSGQIASLQDRGKTLDQRLVSRKALERSLRPLVESITITPDLVRKITETQIDETWLEAIARLESHLLAIKTGPRVAARQSLDNVAELLRIKAAEKIRAFFVEALMPYKTSIAPNLQILQTSVLLRYRELFAFLQRHALKTAHEVQKVYLTHIRWYYETGFRRYVRSLERIRARSSAARELIGPVLPGTTLQQVTSRASKLKELSELGDSHILLAYMADDLTLQAQPEQVFRSIAIVLFDNVASEYAFISSFFGAPAPAPIDPTSAIMSTSETSSSAGWDMLSRDDGVLGSSIFSGEDRTLDEDDAASVTTTSDLTGSKVKMPSYRSSDRAKSALIESMWLKTMEPCLEYASNFASSLLELSQPGPSSILCMIRLNEAITLRAVVSRQCPCAAMEAHLQSIRLALWPAFQKKMGEQIDSVKQLSSDKAGSISLTNALRSRTAPSADHIRIVAARYGALFQELIVLSSPDAADDAMASSSLLRLRNEVERLIISQSTKMIDRDQAAAFILSVIRTVIEQLAQGYGTTSHPRGQAEIGYFRELERRPSVMLQPDRKLSFSL
ncbi:uncharacterized protein L969DRAFT_87539 [Mixia osmundae IAM 14324]|uniref:Uncharacterized protein n=1 Tax=Mixia osmundae (strain CBS 9802 / IAM 14324 / JCM 22182 / KY 12970) TaxID=764103 RepID=G7DVX2_MIXOS|nr:uncharacterized protein L969DRAFT_87539 [Mixia osmundae IAM 14324]KEI39586.1 hypothetical protein L969DRAFT_87539 [Mixia osmundae IAM 14324]GAA94732.1 hypothetical protein E5Q_01386 [Mixia osmundae IAM 14324]